MNNSLYIGVLSGTSMDAIDVALVDLSHNTPNLKATLSYPIPNDFQNRCLTLSQIGHCHIDDYGMLDAMAGELFSDAVLRLLKKENISPKRICAIGSHGQNIRHRPDITPPFSLQIGDPNIIAERTGILTIADFRRRDIAAGGQGAPLAPGFHASVFGNKEENRIIINIGGISNITILAKDLNIPVSGFDMGPGNCLMDGFAKLHLNQSYDKDGRFAASGTIHPLLLQKFLEDPYFAKKPPKSTGREHFNGAWLNEKLRATHLFEIPSKDIQATLLALTVQAIANTIERYAPENSNIFVCGGGVHNTFLMQSLSKAVHRTIQSTEVLGVPPDWVEAMLFAWLAKQTLEGKAGNCPSVTGARNATALGGMFGLMPSA